MNEKVKAVVTHPFTQSPEEIFKAWLDPEIVKKWMFPNGDVGRIEIDPRVGGSFSFVDHRDGMAIDHRGDYLEIGYPHRIVFTWGIPEDSPDKDRVEINIAPTDSGSKLTLTVEMDPNWADYIQPTEKAWSMMLNSMDEVLNQ
ncbi:SRPBCC family protein [Halobacillus naozhouensis]|uniref:SRPBCC family protein n=1 Tax=Halobacillus naozhouensis TaxID=554880 RepID=A0ABY8IX08_9BACI|nr:SRPBCC family protein [Halobacillus naozhouensis]WFT74763.1 SRPBCC family protein [Halobacillus naozhouensis]